ncbi:hypothetical protein ACWGK1_35515, partial [Streptomyces wedmorensis]
VGQVGVGVALDQHAVDRGGFLDHGQGLLPPPAVPAGVNAVTGEIGPGYAAPQQGNEPPF